MLTVATPHDESTSPGDRRATTLRVEFQTELSQLPPLAERWEALNSCRSDNQAPFFQSFAWNHHVAQICLAREPRRFRLLLATIWRDSDLIGIWPLSLQRSSGTWLARSLDDPFGQFAGVSFRDEADIAPGIAAVIRALRGRADGMCIEAVTAGSPLHAALLRHEAKMTATQDAVVVDLRPFASFEDFMKTIGGEKRRVLRKRRQQLEASHRVQHIVAGDPESLAAIVKETFNGRTRWLHENGRTSPAFRRPEFKTIVEGLPGRPGIELLATSLKSERSWIASEWGFAYAGAYYYYMTAMDSNYDQFSPGRVKMALLLEECFRRGLKVVELLAPAMRYKLEWNGSTKRLETLSLPLSYRGWLAMSTGDWIVAHSRRLSRALPEGIRRTLVRRLNKT